MLILSNSLAPCVTVVCNPDKLFTFLLLFSFHVINYSSSRTIVKNLGLCYKVLNAISFPLNSHSFDLFGLIFVERLER